ncbi:MAG: D-glycerate dehydrogenase [Pseudomonadota bacterium]
MRIFLTRRWPDAVERRMAELGEVVLNTDDHALDRAELIEALNTCEVVCPTVTDNLRAEVWAAAQPRTGLLANFGVGYNHIDLSAAAEHGVKISNTPGVLTDATAEIALSLLMMTARRTAEGERHVRAGEWTGWRPTHMLSSQVCGKTLGIVGMGRIGVRLARMAKHGLGMHILYHNRSAVAESVALELAAARVDLDTLLGSSDFVSLNCPATAETHHLINARTLGLMQSHAHLINTARGDVVDEAALADALNRGEIAGAGLDVFEAEPAIAPALMSLSQVVLLPHMGSGTVETREAMGMCALRNVEAYINGEPLPNQVGA